MIKSRISHFMPTQMATFFVGIILITSGCGSQKEQDLAEAKKAPDAGPSQGGFVVRPQQGADNAQPASLGCATELKQEVIINPKSSGITAIFAGKVSVDCEKSGKKATLFIQSPGEFKIGPEFGCVLNQGDFNVRCQGSAVKASADGTVSITIAGDARFESSQIKMRFSFE